MTPELRQWSSQWVAQLIEKGTLTREELAALETSLLQCIESPEGRSLIALAITQGIDLHVRWLEEHPKTLIPNEGAIDTLHRLHQQCSAYLDVVPKEELVHPNLSTLANITARSARLITPTSGLGCSVR